MIKENGFISKFDLVSHFEDEIQELKESIEFTEKNIDKVKIPLEIDARAMLKHGKFDDDRNNVEHGKWRSKLNDQLAEQQRLNALMYHDLNQYREHLQLIMRLAE